MTKICDYCTTKVDDGVKSCPSCGSSSFTPVPEDPAKQAAAPVVYNIFHNHPPQPQAPPPPPPPPQPRQQVLQGAHVSHKNRLTCLVLVIFLGFAGVHRYYVGRALSGVLLLVFFLLGCSWTPMLYVVGGWVFYDFILILSGYFKDADELSIRNWKT
jgi:TM2 domain-containing membrane protein YozV